MAGPFDVYVHDWNNNQATWRVRFETELVEERYSSLVLSYVSDSVNAGQREVTLAATAGIRIACPWTDGAGRILRCTVRQADIFQFSHDPAVSTLTRVHVQFGGQTYTSDVIAQQAPDGFRNMFSWPNVMRTWIDRVQIS